MQRSQHDPVNRHPFHWVVVAILTFGLLLGIGLAADRVGAGLLLGMLRLSTEADECDAEPRSAASADGQWLATAWISRPTTSQGCVTGGDAVIRWATDTAAAAAATAADTPPSMDVTAATLATADAWSPVQALPLPTGACAVHTDVAVAGSTAHVVASYWSPCNASDADSGIRYYTCDLNGSACTSHGAIVTQSGSANLRISDARLTLDSQERPHVAYARGTHGLSQGDIMYVRWTGTSWSSPTLVSTGNKIGGFYRPTIAAGGGRIHIAWERHRDYTDGQGRLRTRGDVQVRACDENTGACQPDPPLTFPYPDSGLVEPTYPMPSIAARDGRVILVWNVCADVNSDPPCNAFYLLYTRSNDNGTSWLIPREVGTERSASHIGLSLRTYAGNDNGLAAGLVSEYAASTRPNAAIDQNGLPLVAWQAEIGGGYVITTTRATGGTNSDFTWDDTSLPQIGDGSESYVSPGIMLADPTLDPAGVHVVFMKAWLEDTGTVEASRAQIYYDYRGDRTRTLEADVPVATRDLPQERATIVRARVLNQTGAPVSGVDVTFATDFGSFDFSGSGSKSTIGTSDATGWASVTLYTNLPGTASIDAWLDTTRDGTIDAFEPSVTQTRTWVNNTTPAISVGTSSVKAGDLMTATLIYHPYNTPEGEGHSTPYVLWWCPRAGATQIQAMVAGPLTTDITTWSTPNLVLRVPSTAQGTYALESYPADIGEDPCGSPYYVAISVEIDSVVVPPPSTPWIDVDDDRPAPGVQIQASLMGHAAGTYALWWCPAASNAAPVTQKLASVTVSVTDVKTQVYVKVPTGASGLYRLETHTSSGGCDDAASMYGQSGLLDPVNRIALPLVLRNRRH